MKSQTKNIYLINLILIVFALLVSCSEPTTPNNTDQNQQPDFTRLNSYIQSIPGFEEPETFKNEVSSTTETVTQKNADNTTTTYQLTKTIYSISENYDTFMSINPNLSVLWPGNLVQGKSLLTASPAGIPLGRRAEGTVSLAILSGDASGVENKFFRAVPEVKFSAVNQAMNEILAGYTGNAPANYQLLMEIIENSSDLDINLKLGFSGSNSVSGKFNMHNDKSKVAVKLWQSYFTMVFDDPAGLAGIFKDTITPEELAPYTSEGNPICYISSITFGRVYILLYESSASRQDLFGALNLAFSSFNGSGEGKFNEVMSQTTVQILQLGGDAATGMDAGMAKDFNKIKDFLIKGAQFSSKNVGAPIFYTVNYLRDANPVRMNKTTEYTHTECTETTTTE